MNLYERYHKDRRLQRKLMDKGDFTYRTVLAFLKKYERSNILDIGCGVGTTSLYLASKGNSVLGIDISKNGIHIARKNATNLNLNKSVRFSVLNFPIQIPKNKFDLIICSEVLEHIKNDLLAVKKIADLLNKDGIVIASSPSINAPLFKLGMLNKFDQEVGHLRRYSVESYKKLFNNKCLKIIEVKKVEGVLRNFLFTSKFGGFLLRLLNKKPFSLAVNLIDDLTIPVFGESCIYLVARKK